MRIVRYRQGTGPARQGVLDGDVVRDFIGEDLMHPEAGSTVAGLDEVDLLAPARPAHIICVARNYRRHAAEMGMTIGETPQLFLKPQTSLVGPGEPIVIPEMSERTDYEAELAVVFGRSAHQVPAEDYRSAVAGFTCGNDVTARDLKAVDDYWLRAKGFPTFCPVGPWIETDLDPGDVKVRCRVDGELRQDDTTADMTFDVPWLVEFITSFMRVEPGDVLLTGTPSGIGQLHPGQEVAVDIEGIGVLANPVVAAGGGR